MPRRKAVKRSSSDNDDDNQPTDNSGGPVPELQVPTTEATLSPEVTSYSIPFGDDKSIKCESHGEGDLALIFTHGAGGGLATPATADFAAGFGAVSRVLCFQGNMNLTSRVKFFRAAVDSEDEEGHAALGGRSMGARAAVMAAAERAEDVGALVLVSYPLTGGKSGTERERKKREQILIDLPEHSDVLFVIGSEDSQCPMTLLAEVREEMKARSWLLEVRGADHGMSLKPKKGAQPVRLATGSISAQWLQQRDAQKRYGRLEWNDEDEQFVFSGWHSQTGSTKSTKSNDTDPREKSRRNGRESENLAMLGDASRSHTAFDRFSRRLSAHGVQSPSILSLMRVSHGRLGPLLPSTDMMPQHAHQAVASGPRDV